MKLLIKRINLGLVIILAILVVSGLTIMAMGNGKTGIGILLITAVISPILLATKGIEFMIKNELRKAFLSILLLSVVCVISIIFVFI
jgi:hypothetical protein